MIRVYSDKKPSKLNERMKKML